jgi:membrane-bound lytic murein transglycosylase B
MIAHYFSAKKFLFLVRFAIFMPLSLMMLSEGHASGYVASFNSLKASLISDGFDKDRIDSAYDNPAVFFDVKGLTQYFKHRESKLNYDQFTQQPSIAKARQYLDHHKADFEVIEDAYGVEKEVITAIILVETRLGNYTGNRLVLNTLSSMAALSNYNNRMVLWEAVSNMRHYSKKKFSKWVKRRSRWAYLELKSFLTYTEREQIDPAKVVGSYAGAMGISQFMPSNVLAYAKDGDQDGRVDLFTHPDAIASVASYLKHYGWHPGINKDKAYAVIYRYNHSKYYVNTVLKITNLLKG